MEECVIGKQEDDEGTPKAKIHKQANQRKILQFAKFLAVAKTWVVKVYAMEKQQNVSTIFPISPESLSS